MEQNTVPSVFDEMEREAPMFEYATTGQRFVNFLMDLLVYFVFSIIVLFVLAIFFSENGSFAIIGWRMVLFTMSCYFTVTFLMEGLLKGKSVGKFVTGTRAVREDLSPITWKDALLRSLCRLIPIEPLSGLGGSPWHDNFTKTFVIKNRMQQL